MKILDKVTAALILTVIVLFALIGLSGCDDTDSHDTNLTIITVCDVCWPPGHCMREDHPQFDDWWAELSEVEQSAAEWVNCIDYQSLPPRTGFQQQTTAVQMYKAVNVYNNEGVQE